MSIVSLARYWRKRDWDDQEIAEFQRVCDTLRQAGFAVATDRGVTDEGDPWFIFLREGSDEVIAHFARIDGAIVADSSALEAPLHGRELRGVLEQTFRQYALLPVSTGSGNSLLLHPAALLTAFVATAFLQLEHGEQNLALSQAGALGLAAAGGAGDGDPDPASGDAAGGAAGAAADGVAAHAGEAGVDGLKALLSRLPQLFGAGPAPANASGRAVSFTDNVTASDSTTAHSVMLTTLVAALGALQTVDVAAAEPQGDGEGSGDADVDSVPSLYTTDLMRATNEAPHPNGLARAAREGGAAHGNLDGMDGNGESPSAEADLAGGSRAPADGTTSPPSVSPDLAQRSERVPITFDSNTIELAGPTEPARNTAEADGIRVGFDDASGSGADARGSQPDGDDTRDPSHEADRRADSVPSGNNGTEAGSMLSLDMLVFGSHDGSNPALSGVRDFLSSASAPPTPINPAPSSLFALVARAYGVDEPGAADFVVFDGGDIPYSGFAYRSDVVFVQDEAVAEAKLEALHEEQTTRLDLAGGGELTLLGVVTLAADAGADPSGV